MGKNFNGLAKWFLWKLLDTLSDPVYYQIQIPGLMGLDIINDLNNKGVGRAKEKMLFSEISPFPKTFALCHKIFLRKR